MERRAAELKFAANLRGKRQRLIASFNTRVVLYYALLMPTVAKVAPPMAAACRRCRINALILRNVLSSAELDWAAVELAQVGEAHRT